MIVHFPIGTWATKRMYVGSLPAMHVYVGVCICVGLLSDAI